MVEDPKRLACEKEPDAQTGNEPTGAHAPLDGAPEEAAPSEVAPSESAPQADHFTEMSGQIVEPPVDVRELQGPSVATPPAFFNQPARLSAAMLARRANRKMTVVALILSIGLYALLGVLALLLLHRLRNEKPATWHNEKNDGAAPASVSPGDYPAVASELKLMMPSLPTPSESMPPLDVSPTEANPRVLAAQSFPFEPTLEPDEPTEEPILISVGPMRSFREALPVSNRPKPATQPVSDAVSGPATTQSTADPAGSAAVAADRLAANVSPAAALASGAPRRHVWTHAGPGGAGGHGGSADGLDSRGVPIPDYPLESKRRNEKGVVQLEVEIRADGTVGNIKVIADAGFPRLAAAAIEAIRRGHFIPATCDGYPVADKLIIPYRFVLR